MMEQFNKCIDSSWAVNMLANKKYALIYGGRNGSVAEDPDVDKRSSAIKRMLPKAEAYWIRYYCESDGYNLQESFAVDGLKDDNLKILNYSNIKNFILELRKKYLSLVIDFSIMNVRVMGAILASIVQFTWEEVYFCYTEPEMYNRRWHDGDQDKISFDFGNKVMGFEEIPGLESDADPTTTCRWVTILGFEKNRLTNLQEEVSYQLDAVVPVICIPPMKIYWYNHAIEENISFIKEVKQRNELERFTFVSAIDPFVTYNFLCSEHELGERLVVSPLGTKPTILGTLMYVLENKNDMLLFDNPYQTVSNTSECGKSHFYDLTDYVTRVKNLRIEE